MAKWGEGDPRWIVEERPDATNVNNWHWSEKNAGPWSKERLKQLLVGLEVSGDEGECRLTEIKRCEGEATANNRKAKLIFLYEWDIKCQWEGETLEGKDLIEGSIDIPNLSDEFSAEEVTVEVHCDSRSEEAESLKSLMRTKGVPLIKDRVAQYIKELKDEFSKGLILPTKEEKAGSGLVNGRKAENLSTQVQKEIVLNKEWSEKKAKELKTMGGVPISTKTLEIKEEFKCTANDLFNAFTDKQMVSAFSNGPCEMDAVKSGQFSLYNGMVNGIFDEVTRPERIVMRWRLKSYPPGHYSVAQLTLSDKGDATELKLRQTGVPEGEFEQTEMGWRRHYFEAMKATFGLGARLF